LVTNCFQRGPTQELNEELQKKLCALTEVEGLSSFDFRAFFLPSSGSFSGAPASKATPIVDHSDKMKQGIVTKDR